MKKLFGATKQPELVARDAIRQKHWSKALAYYESKASSQERDYSLWNLVGDLHMSNKSRGQAIEAWRRALEGYVLEGLHENVLGIGRKMLRRAPEEEDVYLILAEAYLGLEYYADCLAQIRSYVKLAKQQSEQELRSSFKKILESDIRSPHLLEELASLYTDSKIEDVETQQRLTQYVESRLANREYAERSMPSAEATVETALESPAITRAKASEYSDYGGLNTLDETMSIGAEEFPGMSRGFGSAGSDGMGFAGSANGTDDSEPLPAGDGKDHYDLGVVYREMKLWDAGISEFEQARRDPAIRLRASLALAECLQESGDLQGALTLLENEQQHDSGSPSEQMGLHYQLGVVHELVGNLDQALEQFELVRQQNASHEGAGQKVAELSRRLGRNPV
ncbi:tetratricopeptide repeat protein [candidate division KSB1 bacterium]|nr:tetratricopeptide repeat protein [candidate division KSB1 bacterium]